MRYFFLTFLTFLSLFLPPKDVLAESSSLSKVVQNIIHSFESGTQNIASKIGNLNSDFQFDNLSSEEGFGDWLIFPYGDVSLIAFNTGIKQVTKPWFAVYVDLKQDFEMLNPKINVKNNDNFENIYISRYISEPLERYQQNPFKNSFFIPFYVELKKEVPELSLDVDFSFDLCHNGNCEKKEIPLFLKVNNKTNGPTSFAMAILSAAQKSVIPLSEKEIKLSAPADDILQVELNFPFLAKKIKSVLTINEKNTLLNIIYRQIGEEKSILRFKAPHSIIGEIDDFILSGDGIIFATKQPVGKGEFKKLPVKKESYSLFWQLCLLFFTCPLFYMWFSLSFKNERQVADTVPFILISMLTAYLLTMSFFSIINPTNFGSFYQSLIWCFTGLVVFLLTGFGAIKLNVVSFIGLTLLFPYTLNLSLFDDLTGNLFKMWLVLGLMTLIFSAPYIYFLKNKYAGVAWSKWCNRTCITGRFGLFIGAFIYLTMVLAIIINRYLNLPECLADDRDKTEVVFQSGGENWSFPSAWNRFLLSVDTYTEKMKNAGKIHICTFGFKSDIYQKLKQETGILTQPVNRIDTRLNPEGYLVESHLKETEIRSFISDNYFSE